MERIFSSTLRLSCIAAAFDAGLLFLKVLAVFICGENYFRYVRPFECVGKKTDPRVRVEWLLRKTLHQAELAKVVRARSYSKQIVDKKVQ